MVTGLLSLPSSPALVSELALAAPLYLCSLARTVTVRLTLVQGQAVLQPSCFSCCPGKQEQGQLKTPTKGISVSAKDCAPLLKLVGHPEASVRLRLVALLRSCSVHTDLSEVSELYEGSCSSHCPGRSDPVAAVCRGL